MPFKIRALCLTVLSLCIIGVSASAAAAYPEKPVRLIVPFPAGGATDTMARLLAQALTTRLGQSVYVDNRPGSGGSIAAQAVATSAPDGYTLFFGTTGTMAINPALYKRLSYDPLRDFAPIGPMATHTNLLVVNPALPYKTVGELIAAAKAQPKKFLYGSSGNGSSSHLAGALFESAAGVQMTHVPYKGSAPALLDLQAGRIDLMLDTISTHAENVKAGKLRALGVTSPARSSLLPQVPTIAEAGVPGFDVTIWYGLLAPAAVPKDIVTRLGNELRAISNTHEFKARLQQMGAEPFNSSPAEFTAFIKQEQAKWAKVVEKSGASID
jgi:tripartite-type tricarboxylate transporter receptor subunit TctC